jgi:hypothetical protein
MAWRADADDECDARQDVCSDLEEAVYLLTKRDAVVYDRTSLAWKCSIPARSPIDTRFGKVFDEVAVNATTVRLLTRHDTLLMKVLCLVARKHDGTLVCSHPGGTAYLSVRAS